MRSKLSTAEALMIRIVPLNNILKGLLWQYSGLSLLSGTPKDTNTNYKMSNYISSVQLCRFCVG